MFDRDEGSSERKPGRPKGARNLRSSALAEKLAEEGRDPAEALVRIAEAAEAKGDLTLAADAWKALLPYVHAKLKPIESDPDGVVALAHSLKEARTDEAATSFGQMLRAAVELRGLQSS